MAKKKKKSAKKKSGNIIFGLTSRVLMTIVAALLILSYASIVVNPAKVWLISLTGLLFVPLSVVNLLLLLWAIKRRSKSLVIPLLALLPAFFFVGRYVQADTQTERDTRQAYTGESLKVMTYNVGRFLLHDKTSGVTSQKGCADSVFAFIRSQNPDLVCLQEVHVDDVDKIRREMAVRMPGYSVEARCRSCRRERSSSTKAPTWPFIPTILIKEGISGCITAISRATIYRCTEFSVH